MTTKTAANRTRPPRSSVPSKGGDGGVYRAAPEPRHWRDNGRVVLTGAADDGTLLETIDPADVAHLVRQRTYADHGPMTLANSMLAEPGVIAAAYGEHKPTKPRRYHPSQVTSRGMPYDSMFDTAAQTAARLQQALGIDLGWRTRYPRAEAVVYSEGELARAGWLAGMGANEARQRVQRRCRSGMTPEEMRLEREANRLLGAGSGRK